jgi:hypothetical protein
MAAPSSRGSAIEQWFLVDTRPLAAQSSGLLSRLCHQLSPDQEGDREIYRGILSTQIKLVKSFSLCTSLIGIGNPPLSFAIPELEFVKLNPIAVL